MENPVDNLAEALMRAVARLCGPIADPAGACAIMRDELAKFIRGEGEYGEVRRAIIDGARLAEEAGFASLVANSVERVQAVS